jgi:NAD(P)-dependent dehydrogenase (short-subunit alcohol dehydrogenase family)
MSSRRVAVLTQQLVASRDDTPFILPAVAAKLAGQVAVVTGAGSGIGKATAELFARHGAAVLCVDLNGESVHITADEINAKAGGSVVALAHKADTSVEAESQGIVQAALAAFPDRGSRLDVYFANAGILGKYVEVEDMNVADVERTLRINLIGPMLAVKVCLVRERPALECPRMSQATSGRATGRASVRSARKGKGQI